LNYPKPYAIEAKNLYTEQGFYAIIPIVLLGIKKLLSFIFRIFIYRFSI